MWDLPRPGIEPVSPALAGKFLTTVPPGKSLVLIIFYVILLCSKILSLPQHGLQDKSPSLQAISKLSII